MEKLNLMRAIFGEFTIASRLTDLELTARRLGRRAIVNDP